MQAYIDTSFLRVEPPDPENPKQLNGFILTWIEIYQGVYCDRQLLLNYQEDFDGWTKDEFGKVYGPIAKRLKDFLRFRGIYVGNTDKEGYTNKGVTVPQQLAALLDTNLVDSPEWPRQELEDMLKQGGAFMSYVYNPGFDKDDKPILQENTKPVTLR